MHPAIQRAVDWLRAGYPKGIPSGDYIPLVALLSRRLTEDELQQLGSELEHQGLLPADRTDIGNGFLKLTDEVASPAQIQRVADRLRAAGWEVDEALIPAPPPEPR